MVTSYEHDDRAMESARRLGNGREMSIEQIGREVATVHSAQNEEDPAYDFDIRFLR
jgi:hypothetical protein